MLDYIGLLSQTYEREWPIVNQWLSLHFSLSVGPGVSIVGGRRAPSCMDILEHRLSNYTLTQTSTKKLYVAVPSS
jgi:hypothetical protein